MSVLIPYHNFTVICSAGRIQHFREVMDTIQYQNKISQYRIVRYNTQTCCCTLGQSPVRLEWTETTRPCCCCWEHGSISLLPVKHCDFICDCLCIKYSLSTATVLTFYWKSHLWFLFVILIFNFFIQWFGIWGRLDLAKWFKSFSGKIWRWVWDLIWYFDHLGLLVNQSLFQFADITDPLHVTSPLFSWPIDQKDSYLGTGQLHVWRWILMSMQIDWLLHFVKFHTVVYKLMVNNMSAVFCYAVYIKYKCNIFIPVDIFIDFRTLKLVDTLYHWLYLCV